MPVLRTFTWTANVEAVSGYKLYAGTRTGTYNDANSPKDMGNVLSGVFTPAQDSTRFYALTAYDATSESSFSAESEFIHPLTQFLG